MGGTPETPGYRKADAEPMISFAPMEMTIFRKPATPMQE
jgi:hypothetical protein